MKSIAKREFETIVKESDKDIVKINYNLGKRIRELKNYGFNDLATELEDYKKVVKMLKRYVLPFSYAL